MLPMPKQKVEEFSDGNKVYLIPEYAGSDAWGEKFTLSQVDLGRKRGWISDKQGRGWYIHFGQITKTNHYKMSKKETRK